MMHSNRPLQAERERILSVTLADCDVQAKRGSGAGGQNRNKRDTAVRIVHRASGAVGESSEERSQYQNKRTAFRRMVETPRFKTWLNRELWLLAGMKSPEQQVAEDMAPEHIRTETRDERGRWAEAE